MKRPPRIIFSATTLVSGLLCVATATLWLRSYTIDDQLGTCSYLKASGGATIECRSGLFSSNGRITLCDRQFPDGPQTTVIPQTPTSSQTMSLFSAKHGSFEYWYSERDESFVFGFGSNYGVRSIPHAYFLVLFAILPVRWMRCRASDRDLHWPSLFATYAVTAIIGWVGTSSLYFVFIPLFICFVVPCVVYASLQYLAKRIVSKVQTGHCLICGYDLRATPDRCPECGTLPTGKTT